MIINQVSVTQLRDSLDGRVISAGDAQYDETRKVFYHGIDLHPAAIVRVRNTDDIVRAVEFARENGLELAVRCGGHSLAGYGSTEGGLVIDLSAMKGLEIDVTNRSAWAEGGLKAAEYTTAVGAHGLATGFGDTGAVGIGGLTLGGGMGFLVRKYGLTIDELLAAEIVTAAGEVLHVDADSHPDLFWAIRGGGGNFGVVSRFKYRLREVDPIVGGMLILPATAGVIAGFVAAAEAAPDELSAIGNILLAPPMPFLPPEATGKPIIMILLAYAGDAGAGEKAAAPFRALATPYADMVRPMRYSEIYQFTEGEAPPLEDIARSGFLEKFDEATAETILSQLQASTAAMAITQLRVLGGAVARVPAEATAYAHRRRGILFAAAALYEQAAETPQHLAWINGYVAALPHRAPGVYVNFLADEGPERVREAYPGATWDRLAAVKAKYDPDNFFRRNHNVPPR